MQRAVQNDHIKLRRRERQCVKVRFDNGKRHRVMTARAETVDLVVEAIDGNGVMTERREPMGQPSAARAEVERTNRALPHTRKCPLLKMRVALPPDPPFGS